MFEIHIKNLRKNNFFCYNYNNYICSLVFIIIKFIENNYDSFFCLKFEINDLFWGLSFEIKS